MFADDVMIFYKAHSPPYDLSWTLWESSINALAFRPIFPNLRLYSGVVQPNCIKSAYWLQASMRAAYPSHTWGPNFIQQIDKMECRTLVDKVMAKVRLWSTRSISLAGRA